MLLLASAVRDCLERTSSVSYLDALVIARTTGSCQLAQGLCGQRWAAPYCHVRMGCWVVMGRCPNIWASCPNSTKTDVPFRSCSNGEPECGRSGVRIYGHSAETLDPRGWPNARGVLLSFVWRFPSLCFYALRLYALLTLRYTAKSTRTKRLSCGAQFTRLRSLVHYSMIICHVYANPR